MVNEPLLNRQSQRRGGYYAVMRQRRALLAALDKTKYYPAMRLVHMIMILFTVTTLLVPPHGLVYWLCAFLVLEILKLFQQHSLLKYEARATDQYISALLWSAFSDFLSLLCTLYGTFICSTPEESDHLATFTVSLILFYGYVYAFRFTFVEIIVLCLIAPLITLWFSFHESGESEPKGVPKELVQLLAKQPCQEKNTDGCIICMENFEVGEMVVKMPCDARHCFHEKCVLVWLERADKCPVCNAKITKESFNKKAKTVPKITPALQTV